ncbi:MAG: sulfite exporter TauE/SafE family protein [Hyphomicrobiales bacterium]|nr:sulfite exporter TauE/SafE family protein [Hyphomicrobiales bacterium]
MTTALLIAIAIASAAGLMRGFAGVGSGMLMAPFFVKLFGPIDTIAIIIMMELVVTAQLLPTVWREIDWRVIAPMGGLAALSMPLGSWLLVSLDPKQIATGIAALVMLFAAVLMTGWRYEGPKPLWATLGVGSVSGVLMALTSLGNPPVMLYLLSSRDPAATNRANFTGYFAITLIALIAMMTLSGLIGWNAVTMLAALLPVFMIFAWIGSRLFRQSSELIYRRVALGILFCAGLYNLIQ